ncbi:acyl-CoA dehydratase activase-related protein [Sporosalibacterium faouarense]|uniref:acyl-CoA dehydratase activase-related protein n=1 Tax=Sporosalibacterium faouarense TaxID=516123 RepID=UPI00192B8E36|nr:acyl-CoA dehydratase activase-related protein [Sporosalibacterium faouarense]
MTYKVGIPQGLLFYDYYPLWKEFLNELGTEVILSKKTNKTILDQGVSNCVDEACLPVKVFHGHVCDLKDKVDYLFIPKFVSIYKKEFICPKFLGLPEMVKNTIEDLPPIIDIEINLRKSNLNLLKAVIKTGQYFTSNLSKIAMAYNKALKHYERYLDLINQGIVPIEAVKMYNLSLKRNKSFNQNNLNIMILGHSYNLYDEHISMNLIKKLQSQDINVLTPEMIDTDQINQHSSRLPKRMFWSFGRKIIGSAFSAIEEKSIHGIIYVSSFGCGIDSILIDLVERKARENSIPFTLLTLDEHTGEAGVNTRVEAFIDMIRWRGKDESNISTHG